MKKLFVLALSICMLQGYAFSGVVLLVKAPGEITDLLAILQQKAKETVVTHNKGNQKEQFIFDIPKYKQHISLAYINRDDIPLKQLEKAVPTLSVLLTKVAATSKVINFIPQFKKAALHFYRGTEVNFCNGKSKKNYYYVVLAFTPPTEFITLVKTLRSHLQGISTLNPHYNYDTHLTIGKLFTESDHDPKDIIPLLKEALAAQVKELPHFLDDAMWLADTFTLAAQGGELNFSLQK